MSVDALERHARDLAYAHDLTLPQGRKLSALAVHALDPSYDPDCLAGLADPAVADAYVSSPLGRFADADSVARVAELARRALERGHDTAGAHHLLACVAEHQGEVATQRRHLDDALARDPAFGPARLALGFLAFVTGDVRRARRLLADLDDRRAVAMAHAVGHIAEPGLPVGRNDACPCGSGAKAKRCCPPPPLPLADRAWWLWEKAEQWLRRLPQVGDQVCLAEELAGVDLLEAGECDVVEEVLTAPAFRSVALLEGGMLARFLDRLGPLLPADERALTERWRAARHAVWEVDDTEPGRWLRLVDLVSGEVVQAANGSVSRCTEPGEVVYGVVLPIGEGWLLPTHPVCLEPEEGLAVAELLEARIDPMAVAATVYRGGSSATV